MLVCLPKQIKIISKQHLDAFTESLKLDIWGENVTKKSDMPEISP